MIVFDCTQVYDEAQEVFLQSARPLAALEMRKDLKHWDQAMQLATKLAPEQLPGLSAECAGLLEHRGEFEAALQNYEQARLSPLIADTP